ncbi:MAG: glycosyltransferase family 39 protein [Candidatus Pacebacteria bacterium]|nr:glycosyltransferase family 39 protein [Candidatus Paceibacterota bacterium]
MSTMEKKTEKRAWIYRWAVVGIVVLALFLRLYRVTTIPPSPYWEEAALGYDAYSILKTGKDYHGNAFPLLAFPSFGDYKPSLYFYTIVPFIQVFGLDVLAVRMPSILAGVGIVIVLYFLAKELWDERIGLLAVMFYAVQPWSIQISRVGFETNLATFFIVLGIWAMVRARKHPWFLLFAAVSMGLSLYTYHSARIVAPLLGMGIGFLWFKEYWKDRKACVVAFCTVCVMFVPILWNARSPIIAQRATETSIFSLLQPIVESNTLRDQDGGGVISKLMHHRVIVFGHLFASKYFAQFSPDFLFLYGDDNMRHGTQEFGVLHHWEFFTLLVGLYVMMEKKKKEYWLILMWIGLAGIPAALTTVSPHTLRFLISSPAFAFLSAIGGIRIFEGVLHIKHVMLKGVLFFVLTTWILFDLTMYLHYYFTHYASASARDWQFGYRELISALERNKKPDQKVFITREQGRPSIYYLFFTAYDPKKVQEHDRVAVKDQQELLEVGSYRFGVAIPLDKGMLVASSPGKRPSTSILKTSIYLPNGSVVWDIWEQK